MQFSFGDVWLSTQIDKPKFSNPFSSFTIPLPLPTLLNTVVFCLYSSALKTTQYDWNFKTDESDWSGSWFFLHPGYLFQEPSRIIVCISSRRERFYAIWNWFENKFWACLQIWQFSAKCVCCVGYCSAISTSCLKKVKISNVSVLELRLLGCSCCKAANIVFVVPLWSDQRSHFQCGKHWGFISACVFVI